MLLRICLIQTRKVLQRTHFQTCLWENLLQGREEIGVNDELGRHVIVLLLQKEADKIGGRGHQLCWETDANRAADSICLFIDAQVVF